MESHTLTDVSGIILLWQKLAYRKRELQASTVIVLYAYRAVMQQYGILHYRQPQPRSSYGTAATFVDTVETLEKTRQMLCGHAYSVVAEHEGPLLAGVLSHELYRRMLSCVGNGIIHQIAEHAVEQRPVAADPQLVGQTIIESHFPLRQLERGLPLYALHQVGNIHRFEVMQLRCVVQLVQCRDVLQKRCQSLALRKATLKKQHPSLFVHIGMIENRLQIALNACHRRLQLMRDILRELPFQRILLLTR